MAAVETFGVTWEVVRDWVPELPAALSATTLPTEDSFDRILLQEASDYCARLSSQVGTDPTSAAAVSTSQVYGILQKSIARAVAVRVSMAAKRSPSEFLLKMMELQQARFDLMRDEQASLGDGQNTTVFVATSHVTDAVQVRAAAETQNLGNRLANAGQL